MTVSSPVWGADDFDPFLETAGYEIFGLDFDPETPGLELAETTYFVCSLEAESAGMIRVCRRTDPRGTPARPAPALSPRRNE